MLETFIIITEQVEQADSLQSVEVDTKKIRPTLYNKQVLNSWVLSFRV